MAKSLRKIMGMGSYTTSGRGTTSYCLSDGRTRCTSDDYKKVTDNLIEELGAPQFVDNCQAKYWFKPGLGLVILPKDSGEVDFKYVELDKHCTQERFDEYISKNS